jgi:hypothetical protein
VVLLAVLVAAAVASLVFMFRMGGRNPSALLVVLFTGWVASPFLGACGLTLAEKGLSAGGQVGFTVVSLVVAAGALAFYSGAITVVGARPAFVYLMVPLASWVLLAPFGVSVLLRMRRSRKVSRVGK